MPQKTTGVLGMITSLFATATAWLSDLVSQHGSEITLTCAIGTSLFTAGTAALIFGLKFREAWFVWKADRKTKHGKSDRSV